MSEPKISITMRMPADLWRRIQQAARQESAKTGGDISASEWVRVTAEGRLRKLEDHR